jgi:hypothetical protein
LHLLTAEWLPIKWYFCFFKAAKSGEADWFSKLTPSFSYNRRWSFKNPYVYKQFSWKNLFLPVLNLKAMGFGF